MEKRKACNIDALREAVEDLCKRLKEYEDAEKQRRLLKLPCAVGDTVYGIDNGSAVPMIVSKICMLSLNTGDFYIEIACDAGGEEVFYFMVDFGRIVFRTREGAEEALMPGKRDEGRRL